jgi:hypothetical protein
MSPQSLTRALVGLHGAGRADTYGAALLDVAQDHLLWLLAELGHFDDGLLVFKGGYLPAEVSTWWSRAVLHGP